jgi:hypothetical protein
MLKKFVFNLNKFVTGLFYFRNRTKVILHKSKI